MDECNYQIKDLLKLAMRIQKRIKVEHDADVRRSLKNDFKIVKSHIGNQILDLPEDKKIFPPVKITHYSAANSPIKKLRAHNSEKKTPSAKSMIQINEEDDDIKILGNREREKKLIGGNKLNSSFFKEKNVEKSDKTAKKKTRRGSRLAIRKSPKRNSKK